MLRFSRNASKLDTKFVTIKDVGWAEFNERIEMKTFFAWDNATQNYTPKLSELQVIHSNGTMLGKIDLNLSSYARPQTYKIQIPLTNIAQGMSN